ncbi:MAG: DUF5522 domain-containing protein [Acidimicrobiales bacterium]
MVVGHPGTVMADHPSRPEPGADQQRRRRLAHDRAVAAGDPGYVDPHSGLFVMTSAYLLARGWCCECGCRHCPWTSPEEGEPQ